MRHGSIRGWFALSAVIVVIASCASGETDSLIDNGTSTGSGGAGGTGGGSTTTNTTTSTSTSTSTTTTTTTTGGQCVSSCSTDAQCQSSCPAVATGSNCCDSGTAKCYVSSASVCPSNQGGGGQMQPPY